MSILVFTTLLLSGPCVNRLLGEDKALEITLLTDRPVDVELSNLLIGVRSGIRVEVTNSTGQDFNGLTFKGSCGCVSVVTNKEDNNLLVNQKTIVNVFFSPRKMSLEEDVLLFVPNENGSGTHLSHRIHFSARCKNPVIMEPPIVSLDKLATEEGFRISFRPTFDWLEFVPDTTSILINGNTNIVSELQVHEKQFDAISRLPGEVDPKSVKGDARATIQLRDTRTDRIISSELLIPITRNHTASISPAVIQSFESDGKWMFRFLVTDTIGLSENDLSSKIFIVDSKEEYSLQSFPESELSIRPLTTDRFLVGFSLRSNCCDGPPNALIIRDLHGETAKAVISVSKNK